MLDPELSEISLCCEVVRTLAIKGPIAWSVFAELFKLAVGLLPICAHSSAVIEIGCPDKHPEINRSAFTRGKNACLQIHASRKILWEL
jgi:hypothetical protein